MSPVLQINGHGLAGALLAETASAAGIELRVRDNGGPSASRVAAGLFTPLTGMRLALTWAAPDVFPVLHRVYPALEQSLGLRFFHPLPTLRLLNDLSELPRDCPEGVEVLPCDSRYFHAAPLALRIADSGWVDLPRLLDALRARRIERGEWGEHPQPDLHIDATGSAAARHPLWREAGWRNAHGDVLTLRIPGLPGDHITNFGKFLLPLGGDRFRCGATYTWDHDDPLPRDAGRAEIESALRQTLRLPYEVLDHQAGIRPIALARSPLVGPHPDDPRQWIFNGFGSKGVLYAPWLAERVVANLLRNEALPREVWAPRRLLRQRDRTLFIRRCHSTISACSSPCSLDRCHD